MAELMQDEVAYGFDEVVEVAPGEDSLLLEPGEYGFIVSKLERERYDGGEKMPPCNKAVVWLSIETPAGTARVRESFFLLSRFGWKLAEFFKSLGAPTNPETGNVVMAWGSVVGASGRCKIKQREYNNRTYNEVDKWLEPAAQAPAPAVAATPQQAAQQQMPGMPAPSQPGAGGGYAWS